MRAVIVTGAGRALLRRRRPVGGGGRHLRLRRAARPGRAHPRRRRPVTLRIFESKKPVIAAINGPAVGVGVTMTLPMDIRIASSDARFGFVFARRGIVPEAASSWFLPRLVGVSQAVEWVYTGRVFPADEALAGRLVEPGRRARRTARHGARAGARDRRQHLGRVGRRSRASCSGACSAPTTRWRRTRSTRRLHLRSSAGAPDAPKACRPSSRSARRVSRCSPSTDLPDAWPWWSPRPFA